MRYVPEPHFRKSSYSQPNGSNCVEVADTPGVSAVRDTKHRDFGHLVFPTPEWRALVEAVKADEL